MIEPNDSPRVDADRGQAAQLQNEMIAFIRAFGLLRAGTTPCGLPLSVSEAHAILELSKEDGLSQASLGQRLRLEKSTISRLINQLQEQGWVARRRDPTDGRVVQLALTVKGRQVAQEVATARASHFASLIEKIPEGEQEAVVQAFRVLVRALES